VVKHQGHRDDVGAVIGQGEGLGHSLLPRDVLGARLILGQGENFGVAIYPDDLCVGSF
jgi:hypothetical protein